jgi:hypothetical protein
MTDLNAYLRRSGGAMNGPLYDKNGVEILGGGGEGATDHGALTGLDGDDHTQYHNDTRGDARYEAKNANIQSHISSTSNPHSVDATDVGLGNVDNTSNATERAAAATLTNKTLIASTNVLEEITTTASSATPTPTGGSLRNFFTVTALAEEATFAAPSGTPASGNLLTIRVKDNGTIRSLAYNAIYRAIGVTLPTATVAGKTMYLGARYNSADTKWDIIAYSIEA